MYEDTHCQYKAGALDPKLWQGYHRLMSSHASSPGVQAYWAERRDTFSPDFVRPVEGLDGPMVKRLNALGDEAGD